MQSILLWGPALPQPEREGGKQEHGGGDGEEARPDQVQRRPVVLEVEPERGHDDGEVAPHQVHQEQEDSDAS